MSPWRSRWKVDCTIACLVSVYRSDHHLWTKHVLVVNRGAVFIFGKVKPKRSIDRQAGVTDRLHGAQHVVMPRSSHFDDVNNDVIALVAKQPRFSRTSTMLTEQRTGRAVLKPSNNQLPERRITGISASIAPDVGRPPSDAWELNSQSSLNRALQHSQKSKKPFCWRFLITHAMVSQCNRQIRRSMIKSTDPRCLIGAVQSVLWQDSRAETFPSHYLKIVWYYPGQKKRPLRLCIKSEHCSYHRILKNQAWLRFDVQWCAKSRLAAPPCQTPDHADIAWSEQCSEFMHNLSGRFFFGQGSSRFTWYMVTSSAGSSPHFVVAKARTLPWPSLAAFHWERSSCITGLTGALCTATVNSLSSLLSFSFCFIVSSLVVLSLLNCPHLEQAAFFCHLFYVSLFLSISSSTLLCLWYVHRPMVSLSYFLSFLSRS